MEDIKLNFSCMQTAMYKNRLSVSEYFGDPKLTETIGIKVFKVTKVVHRSLGASV